MKRMILIVSIIVLALSIAGAKTWQPAFGLGLGFCMINWDQGGYEGDDNGLIMAGDVLVPVYEGLHIKIIPLSLYAGDATVFEFGTGSGVGLLYFFPARGIEPYAGLQLDIESISDGIDQTTLSFLFGGGIQYKLPASPIRLYGEMAFGITDVEEYSETQFRFMFGMRFGGK